MKRTQSALTPENYARAIASLSRRYSSTSVFPGSNYLDLAEWMLLDRNILQGVSSEDTSEFCVSKSKPPHDLIITYDGKDGKWDVQGYSQEQQEDFAAAPVTSGEDCGQLVFIRGFVSPSWVSTIGSKYSLDPEFFRRHMDFLCPNLHRHAFSFPSLASTSNNIYRLCINTIFYRDDFGVQHLNSQRSYQATELGTYKIQQLGSSRACCGDSVVREYSTLCSAFSVMEQWISLCVKKTDRGWVVIAWMDHGRPLESSPPGPWTSHIERKATPLPVLQYHPKMAFRTTTNRLKIDEHTSAKIQQEAAILPLQYDSLLALVDLGRRASQDPLVTCIPLFAHAAFSEAQFLNLMESRIRLQTNAIAEGNPDDALGTFQFLSSILDRHTQQLKDSGRSLSKLAERSSQGLYGGKAEHSITSNSTFAAGQPIPGMGTGRQALKDGGPSNPDGTFSVKGLLEDYGELEMRCLNLSKLCTQGIALANHKATIDEAQKAMEQSHRLKKLTILATVFIPLNFTSSLFGMNLEVLDQGHVGFWWFFILCIPIILVAYVMYTWDLEAVKRYRKRFWQACRDMKRGLLESTNKEKIDNIV